MGWTSDWKREGIQPSDDDQKLGSILYLEDLSVKAI